MCTMKIVDRYISRQFLVTFLFSSASFVSLFTLIHMVDNLDDFYRICVSVPLALVGVASALYLCQGKGGGLQLVCSSERGVLSEPEPACFPVQLHETPYEQNGSYVIPIFSKQSNRAAQSDCELCEGQSFV
jgi:hypothetical protein